ncbi:MAG: acyl carrier protein [Pseudomonadales bacterium]
MEFDENKLRAVFAEALGIPETDVVPTLEYNTIPQWDSLAHMRLIAEIEEAFDIMIDSDDLIDMSSFAISIDMVRKYVAEA